MVLCLGGFSRFRFGLSKRSDRTVRYEIRQANEQQVLAAVRLKDRNDSARSRRSIVRLSDGCAIYMYVYIYIYKYLLYCVWMLRSVAGLPYRWALGGRLTIDRQVRRLNRRCETRARATRPHQYNCTGIAAT